MFHVNIIIFLVETIIINYARKLLYNKSQLALKKVTKSTAFRSHKLRTNYVIDFVAGFMGQQL